jgi:hypothetical protein
MWIPPLPPCACVCCYRWPHPRAHVTSLGAARGAPLPCRCPRATSRPLLRCARASHTHEGVCAAAAAAAAARRVCSARSCTHMTCLPYYYCCGAACGRVAGGVAGGSCEPRCLARCSSPSLQLGARRHHDAAHATRLHTVVRRVAPRCHGAATPRCRCRPPCLPCRAYAKPLGVLAPPRVMGASRRGISRPLVATLLYHTSHTRVTRRAAVVATVETVHESTAL